MVTSFHMVKVLFLLAQGFEEIESIVPIDCLRRAGIEVLIAAVGQNDLNVKGSHDVTIKADVKFNDVHKQLFDAIVCPGGMPGTTNLAKTKEVIDALHAHEKAGKVVAAICAAPGFILAEAAQLLKGKNACGYPGSDEKITENGKPDDTLGLTLIHANAAADHFTLDGLLTCAEHEVALADRQGEHLFEEARVCPVPEADSENSVENVVFIHFLNDFLAVEKFVVSYHEDLSLAVDFHFIFEQFVEELKEIGATEIFAYFIDDRYRFFNGYLDF